MAENITHAPLDPERGIVTYTGRIVRPEEGDVPSLVDIAVALSRHPRFGGHCRTWWSVLDHSLFVERLIRAMLADSLPHPDSPLGRRIRLAGLLHDAHEAITGDIPTPYKPECLKAVQARLDERLAKHYSLPTSDYIDTIVHHFDRRALLAEALLVGPPLLVTPEDVQTHFGDLPAPADVALLEQALHSPRAIREIGRGAAALALGPANKSVSAFLRYCNELH